MLLANVYVPRVPSWTPQLDTVSMDNSRHIDTVYAGETVEQLRRTLRMLLREQAFALPAQEVLTAVTQQIISYIPLQYVDAPTDTSVNGDIYPDIQVNKTMPRKGPMQPGNFIVLFKPDSERSQTGVVSVTLNQGIDNGTDISTQVWAKVKSEGRDVEDRDVELHNEKNAYWFEILNVKSGDDVQFFLRVNFVDVDGWNTGTANRWVQGNVTPRQYPPPEKIGFQPGNLEMIWDGDPRPGKTHGGHGPNPKYPKPNKDLFPGDPDGWTQADVAAAARAIATNPRPYPKYPKGNEGNWLVDGYSGRIDGSRGINITVIVAPGGDIVTAYPWPGQPDCGRTDGNGRVI
ncbi:hypothetical protein ACWCW7_17730 [Nocardia tengchongensis]